LSSSEISGTETLIRSKSKTALIEFGLLLIIILLSRIPFIGYGYGSDQDAWRLAVAARNISINGIYEISRFPGHPFQELFCSLFWKGGPYVLNGFTVLLSTIGIIYFTLILKTLGFKNYIISGLALAFIPIIYINCTNTMDYVWALSFILASLYYILKGNIITSGILMGIAIGCRITSGLMLLPFTILLIGRNDAEHTVKNLAKFILPSLVIGSVLYIPVIMRYGIGFFTFDEMSYPSALIVIKRLTVNVWGILGSAFLIIAVIIQLLFVKSKSRSAGAGILPRKILIYSSFTAVFLYLIAFLRLPHEAGYLLPALPFIFIILNLYMNPRLYRFFYFGAILSSFMFSISLSETELNTGHSGFSYRTGLSGYESVFDVLYGPIIMDMQERKAGLSYVERILRRGEQIDKKSVVAAGSWLPFIDGINGSRFQGEAEYVALFTPVEYRYYYDNGYNFLYLPGEEKSELKYYGIDIKDAGAKSFFGGE
jgi:hypothetical protein